MNPFKYGQVIEGKEYCPRVRLEKQIREFVKSGQNISLQGEFRVGKTSLVLKSIKGIKGKRLLYVNLRDLKTVTTFCKRMVNSIGLLEKKRGVLDKFLTKISYLHPFATTDPHTGEFTILLRQDEKCTPEILGKIFELIKSIDNERSLVVVFDEFQNVENIKEGTELLSILIRRVQSQPNIAYIFIGSVRDKMDGIFNDSSALFLKTLNRIVVDGVNCDSFNSYLIEKFNLGKRKVSKEVLDKIFNMVSGVSGDIQQLCNAIWEVSSYKDVIDEEHLQKAVTLIFTREIKEYEFVLANLTELQLSCLVGLARMGDIGVMSSAFLKSVGGVLPASAKKAFLRMENIKVIYRKENRYKFLNPFFKLWLKTVCVG